MMCTSVIAAVVLVIASALGTVAGQALCPEGFVYIGGSCFHFVATQNTWLDADSYCGAMGGHLAVLNDCNLYRDVVKYINAEELTAVHTWIGATDVVEEGNWVWHNGESVPMGTPFWGTEHSGGTNEPDGDGNCVLIHRLDRHYFQDGPCSRLSESICETNPTEEALCPEGFVPIGGSCFHFVGIQNAWLDADSYCILLGGQLAVLNDCNLFRDVVKYINAEELTADTMWIGATDIVEEGNWVWVNGESVPMGTPFWGQEHGGGGNEPDDDGNCLLINRLDRHRFHDAGCSELCESICETSPIIPASQMH